jgi:hypothetical protein
MSLGGTELIKAKRDFHQAHQRAAMERIIASLTGRSADLLSFQEVYEKLKATTGADRGLHEIQLAAIVGSVGRYQDFSRTFLPRQASDESRWVNVRTAVGERAVDALPPIKVYKIGEAYFVQDGHHRISIARQAGQATIQAYVTEVRTRAPLSAGVDLQELIVKSEYATFLEYTQLDRLRPGADLTLTIPGGYGRFEAHIEAHRFINEMAQGREVDWSTAVTDWYDEAYLPVLGTIREQEILRDFPGRTEADLYLWISDHQLALKQELGWRMRPEVAAVSLPRARTGISAGNSRLARLWSVARGRLGAFLAYRQRPSINRWHHEKLITRYSASLFADLLVPLDGCESAWVALEQAALIAQQECSTVHGLLMVASQEFAGAAALQARFESRCREAGVEGHLVLDTGRPVAAVQARAPLVDLVVLDPYFADAGIHDGQAGAAGQAGATCRAIARRGVRPMLIASAKPSLLARPLLVLDNSAGARDALFVATYLAELWRRPLHVLAPAARSRSQEQAATYARRYLQMHEVEATFSVTDRSPAETLLATVAAQGNDLIITARRGLQSRTAGWLRRSHPLLTDAGVPLLICG